VVEVGG